MIVIFYNKKLTKYSNFSYGILSQENVYVHFYFLMKFILYVHHHCRQQSIVEQILVRFLLFHYEH
jgi:hypothetical protein